MLVPNTPACLDILMKRLIEFNSRCSLGPGVRFQLFPYLLLHFLLQQIPLLLLRLVLSLLLVYVCPVHRFSLDVCRHFDLRFELSLRHLWVLWVITTVNMF